MMPHPDPVRILLLEDQPADAELATHALEQSGTPFSIDVVDTESDMDRLLDREEYDVILADHSLRGWSGLDAFRAVRSRGMETPFILVTGTLGEERAVECFREGITDCVFKRNLAMLPIAVDRALREHRVREQGRQAEARVRLLSVAVEQGPASVFITDTEGRIEYVNRRFTEITGYPAREVLGRTPRVLRSGEARPGTWDGMWRTLRAGGVWRGEIPNRRKNGEIYWDALTVSPVRDPQGAVVHYLAVHEDVTTRRAAARELRERDERFRQIANNIREVFYVVDRDFRKAFYVNPAYEAVWGRSMESVYRDAASFLEGVVPEDRGVVEESIRRVQSGVDPMEVEFRVERPDGGRSWVLAHAVPILSEDGAVERICGVVLDITERRLAEDRLRLSEARFRQICEASFDGIVVSSGGVITEVNPGFQGIFRCSAEEAVGKPVSAFIGHDPADLLESQAARAGRGPREIDARALDGTEMVLEATTRAHRNDGRTSHITALRDVTEMRALEQQFQFSQRMEAVGRLAGGVAHDFNNLLTVIRVYADLIREQVTDESPVAQEIDEILRASDSASALTRQLLAFSRRQAIEPTVIDVGQVVRGGVRMLEPLLGEAVEVSMDVPSEPLRAVMDPHQLEQVLMNLAANARDAMPTGGVLSIRASRVDLDASFARGHWDMAPGAYIRLTVSDTGVGMSEDVRSRVFEPFFTTKGQGEGTGLGLSSVYGIVRQSGGFIWVYSEPGQGATFKVHLPEVDSPVPAPGAGAEPGPAPAGGSGEETILVVEDLPAVRSAVRRILEGYGYSVLEALTPTMALDLARSHRGEVDLLLTDVIMPEMSGPELARAVQALRPGIRVLFMSGYAPDTAHRMGALEAGADLLEKPFSAEALVGRVRDALGRA